MSHQSIKTKPVGKYTRAGKNGRIVICPKCNGILKLYHFAFSAIVCLHCHKEIEKYDLLVPLDAKKYQGRKGQNG